MATRSATIDGAVHVSGYVDLSLDDVIALFDLESIDTVLTEALRGSSGVTDVTVHASAPERFARASATAPLSWRVRTPDVVAEGHGTVKFLKVRTGHHPVTELLVTLRAPEAPDALVRRLAVEARHFLDELTVRLTSVEA